MQVRVVVVVGRGVSDQNRLDVLGIAESARSLPLPELAVVVHRPNEAHVVAAQPSTANDNTSREREHVKQLASIVHVAAQESSGIGLAQVTLLIIIGLRLCPQVVRKLVIGSSANRVRKRVRPQVDDGLASPIVYQALVQVSR